tara:strand:+ start:73 stop:675 length:603 start_codon:yes stop_codon:yes gene_type:complete
MELGFLFSNIFIRFSFNLFIAFVIIKLIYHRDYKGNDFVFTYFMFNTLIFFFAYILGNLDINMAFGFGLFAVFAILRYRTDPIPIKEMTYLFIVITIGVINALSTNQVVFEELIFANVAIVVMTFFLEKYWVSNLVVKDYRIKTIVYNDMDMIKPENYQKLLDDVVKKTGLQIIDCKVGRINFLENWANVKIYYKKENPL